MAEVLRGVPMQYEPKRNNRFILEFPSELGIETWYVQTTSKPKININPVEIPFFNTSNYVAGRYTWEPISISLLDLIGPSTSQALIEWVRLHAESMTGRQGYAITYKKTLVLKECDPVGIEISQWRLEDCMITDASFGGDGAYDDDGVMTIDFTVQPFRCIQEF